MVVYKYVSSNIKTVQLLVDECMRFGVKNIVISPGSRNAPLIIAFDNHPFFKCYSIPDERSAGFFALGMARQYNSPVALVCTSGTALLNYHPAIVEAFYQRIPLVVISADRPPEMIDREDGQTIRQPEVFANHITGFLNIPVNGSVNDLQNVKIELQKLLKIVHSSSPEPIHINIPLREPLYEVEQVEVLNKEIPVAKKLIPNRTDLEEVVGIWNKSEKILILCGVGKPEDSHYEYFSELVSDKNVVVLAPPTSNVQGKYVISNVDAIFYSIGDKEVEKFAPDLLITFGGQVISKRAKQFLRKNPPQNHFDIDINPANPDTYGCLTKKITMDMVAFIEFMNKNANQKTVEYKNLYSRKLAIVNRIQNDFINVIDWCDLKVFDIFFKNIKTKINLHLANSTPVRYAELFTSNSNINYYSNRGTSGIDGSTSVAVGGAVADTKLTILITGDISFFYDSNAFWNRYVPANFKVILVNNGGGNIFKVIAGDGADKQLDDYFVTSQPQNTKYLCKAFDIEYLKATDETEFTQILNKLLCTERSTVLEVFTDGDYSAKIYRDYTKLFAKL